MVFATKRCSALSSPCKAASKGCRGRLETPGVSRRLLGGAARQQAVDDGRGRDAMRIGHHGGDADPGIARDFDQTVFSMARMAVIF
jgi:hypothetical protein